MGKFGKMCALKLKKYADAVKAFQSGLEVCPDDADLRRGYMEASRLAQKASALNNDGGFDKRMMVGIIILDKHPKRYV